MNPEDQDKTFQPAEVVTALENTINPLFKKERVVINDAGTRYHVKELKEGFFEVDALSETGAIAENGLTKLPCDEHYLTLVINHWTGTRAEAAMGAAASAVGGTTNPTT